MNAIVARSQATTAYADLRRLLLAGEYRPGERLAEVALAERLGMSRTPVREALRRLQADGLVEGSWRGVAVPLLEPAEIGHAYELRAALEALTAEAAARRVRDGRVPRAELDTLRAHAERAKAETARGDLSAALEHNRNFHGAIASMAANPIVADVLVRVWDRIAISTRDSLAPAHRGDEVAEEHDRLVAAIAEGQPEPAEAIARAHVLATFKTLIDPRGRAKCR
jgi:DNA-binding GntR family transcriptional regulator